MFTLSYFDIDTNVALQPDVVYTIYINSNTGDNIYAQSNAFRLSLTYRIPSIASQSSSSSTLSSGAVAGIVVAAVVVALVLVLGVVWLVRRQVSGGSSLWSNKFGSEGLRWSTRSTGTSGSDDYKDVELQ